VRASLALLALTLAGSAPTAVPNDSQPYWSADGAQIAFQRDAPRLDGIHVLFTPTVRGDEADVIGTGRVRGWRPTANELLVGLGVVTSVRDANDRQLANIQGGNAAWSRDGTRIAYVQGATLYASDAGGANAQQLADGITSPPGDVTGPVWSPDGTQLAIETTSGLMIVQADGSGSTIIDSDVGTNPSWSANGSWLAFERGDTGAHEIWIVHPNGTEPTRVLGGDADYRFPQWAPTGDRLAFLRGRIGYTLYVVTVGERSQILLGGVDPESPPRWSPNGSQLAAAAAQECKRFGIYVVQSQLPAQPHRRSNQCRFEGTAAADFLTSTPYLDFVDGFGGNDRIITSAGDDTIDAGAGNDAVSAGPGNDVVRGGAGNDTLSGGTGNDVIYGGPGLDKIGCGPGRDTAYVGRDDTTRDCERVIRVR
jgi:Ca2+-binding RTX toxin-like protein